MPTAAHVQLSIYIIMAKSLHSFPSLFCLWIHQILIGLSHQIKKGFFGGFASSRWPALGLGWIGQQLSLLTQFFFPFYFLQIFLILYFLQILLGFGVVQASHALDPVRGRENIPNSFVHYLLATFNFQLPRGTRQMSRNREGITQMFLLS